MEKVYAILEAHANEGDINYLIDIDFSHPIFQGHFPEKSVLPGVMMCDIVRNLVFDKLGVEVQLVLAKNIKFLVIDQITGRKANFGSKKTIIEAYKKKNLEKNLIKNNNLNLKVRKNNILKFY